VLYLTKQWGCICCLDQCIKKWIQQGQILLDAGLQKKYHMVRWEVMARLKSFGGLGFIDTRLMNLCVLSKWIVKLERGNEDMCTTLLRKKYLKGKGFFCVNPRGGSQFWRRLHEAKEICLRGIKFLVGVESELGSGFMFGWVIAL
jgi:hypothetical protein